MRRSGYNDTLFDVVAFCNVARVGDTFGPLFYNVSLLMGVGEHTLLGVDILMKYGEVVLEFGNIYLISTKQFFNLLSMQQFTATCKFGSRSGQLVAMPTARGVVVGYFCGCATLPRHCTRSRRCLQPAVDTIIIDSRPVGVRMDNLYW